ncbi:MAG: glucose 1-dehydrogenase [Actinomycetia bacterium]|nr:glucose 1-dehydrogenase [Actinomycetes bacterium]
MAMTTGKLDGKVAIVTGGGRGLGRAIALRLAGDGADVAVVDIDGAAAETVAAEIGALGRTGLAVTADVTNEDDTLRYVATAVEALGRLDIQVSNAGIIRVGSVLDTSSEDWEQTFAVNARGVFFGCREAARAMVDQGQGGRIINCSSGAGRIGQASFGAYCASKFAVIGLTQSLAVELAPHSITVNAYCPGHVTTTEMWEAIARTRASRESRTAEEVKAAAVAEVPMGRSASPEEIAAAVSFLASDDAGYITGESLLIDGGLVRF